jgi:hypothetical protein
MTVHVRFAPKADEKQIISLRPLSARKRTDSRPSRQVMHRSKKASLLDHLVNPCEQRCWHFQAERFGGFQVYH